MAKKDIILKYFKEHSTMSINDIAKALNENYATVRYALRNENTAPVQKKARLSTMKEAKAEHADLKTAQFEMFCPKCKQPVAMKICAAEIKASSIWKIAGGKCKCGCNFNVAGV